jgi:hypothetical protein
MSIVKSCRRSQAPLGAACCGTAWREPEIPLLAELENDLVEPRCYQHGAPNGAVPSAQECSAKSENPAFWTRFSPPVSFSACIASLRFIGRFVLVAAPLLQGVSRLSDVLAAGANLRCPPAGREATAS